MLRLFNTIELQRIRFGLDVYFEDLLIRLNLQLFIEAGQQHHE